MKIIVEATATMGSKNFLFECKRLFQTYGKRGGGNTLFELKFNNNSLQPDYERIWGLPKFVADKLKTICKKMSILDFNLNVHIVLFLKGNYIYAIVLANGEVQNC